MSNMEITLYRALCNAKIPENEAQTVVETIEEHVAMKIKEANRSLEIRLNLLIAITTIASAIGGYIGLISR